MERTVLIVAHNESAGIGKCLASIARQTVAPDETVVVCHNCTDGTADVARTFTGVRVDEFSSVGRGPVFARIRGFGLAKHEVVACIDGDSVAEPDWLKRITAPFSNPAVVGTWGSVGFGSFLPDLNAWWFFRAGRWRPGFHFYFWGANFACRKSAYAACGGLEPLPELGGRLGLHFLADDCYLSLALERQGKVVPVADAVVTAEPKPAPDDPFGRKRGRKQDEDRKALFRHFGI